MDVQVAKKKLKKFLADKSERWDLAEASLLIACNMDAEMEPRRYLNTIDQWAKELAPRLDPDDVINSLDQLAVFLGEEQGFHGNSDDYYHPENSMLNRVIDQKVGIPITLSILYLSVAERLGLPLHGVPLPGHFLVAASGLDLWYDPFERGKRLRRADLQGILDKLFGPGTRLTEAMLKPLSKRFILVRLIRNLKQIFVSRQDLVNLLWCADLALILEPKEPELLKERGLVHYQLGQYQAALSDIQAYLQKAPKPVKKKDEEDSGRQHVELLFRVLNSMN